jgi:hypothetical protein
MKLKMPSKQYDKPNLRSIIDIADDYGLDCTEVLRYILAAGVKTFAMVEFKGLSVPTGIKKTPLPQEILELAAYPKNGEKLSRQSAIEWGINLILMQTSDAKRLFAADKASAISSPKSGLSELTDRGTFKILKSLLQSLPEPDKRALHKKDGRFNATKLAKKLKSPTHRHLLVEQGLSHLSEASLVKAIGSQIPKLQSLSKKKF